MRRRAGGLWVLICGLLAACHPGEAGKRRVIAADYDAYYLWAGVRPPPEIVKARELYILNGEVRRDDPARLVALHPQAPRLPGKQLWLVVRSARLDWGEGVYRSLLRDLTLWERAGNSIAGIQVDFDAATDGLSNYAEFLSGLRQRLPRQYRLSVTGLMDWGANADPAALSGLVGVVDEVVMQTYQGRSTIPGYDAYVTRLARLPLPHKLALVQGGEWQEPQAIRSDPRFTGYVVFLVNPDRRGAQ